MAVGYVTSLLIIGSLLVLDLRGISAIEEYQSFNLQKAIKKHIGSVGSNLKKSERKEMNSDESLLENSSEKPDSSGIVNAGAFGQIENKIMNNDENGFEDEEDEDDMEEMQEIDEDEDEDEDENEDAEDSMLEIENKKSIDSENDEDQHPGNNHSHGSAHGSAQTSELHGLNHDDFDIEPMWNKVFSEISDHIANAISKEVAANIKNHQLHAFVQTKSETMSDEEFVSSLKRKISQLVQGPVKSTLKTFIGKLLPHLESWVATGVKPPTVSQEAYLKLIQPLLVSMFNTVEEKLKTPVSDEIWDLA